MSSDWKQLASQEIQIQKVDADIVYATIESETGGRNIMGDNNNAIGYGQVWFKWHKDSFDYAAKRLGIDAPQTLSEAASIAMANDQFSMIVSVKTIKHYWEGCGKNWDRFTRQYVGPAIPDSTYQKRLVVWNKYKGTTFNSPYTSDNSSFTTTTNSSNSTVKAINATNYKVVGNTQLTGEVLYGRRYRVLVHTKNGDGFDVSNLRCTFKIIETYELQPNYSEINIYNLNANTENTILQEGDRIVIEAGYEGDQYGIIYDGDIVQVLREKEDGVTYKLTLIALDGDMFLNYGLIGFTFHRGQSPRNIAEKIITTSSYSSDLGDISDSLNDSKLIRGKTVFGKSSDYLRQIAKSKNATFHILKGKANINKLSDPVTTTAIEISPLSGLINSPMQQDYGMTCQVLLNPKMQIGGMVHIDNSLIKAMQQTQGSIYRELDKEGIYRIIKLTHVGDTRGDEWYTEIETITQAGLLPSMINNPTQNPF